jgi:carbon storage regulator
MLDGPLFSLSDLGAAACERNRILTANAQMEASMLVLSRKSGEKFWIGENIAITVVRISGGGVRIGIEAPEELIVVRDELREKALAKVTKPASTLESPPVGNQPNSKPR